MTATTVITMILILGFVWGGVATLILIAARKESMKRMAEPEESA